VDELDEAEDGEEKPKKKRKRASEVKEKKEKKPASKKRESTGAKDGEKKKGGGGRKSKATVESEDESGPSKKKAKTAKDGEKEEAGSGGVYISSFFFSLVTLLSFSRFFFRLLPISSAGVSGRMVAPMSHTHIYDYYLLSPIFSIHHSFSIPHSLPPFPFFLFFCVSVSVCLFSPYANEL
jgi:hypothetical protein